MQDSLKSAYPTSAPSNDETATCPFVFLKFAHNRLQLVNFAFVNFALINSVSKQFAPTKLASLQYVECSLAFSNVALSNLVPISLIPDLRENKKKSYRNRNRKK